VFVTLTSLLLKIGVQEQRKCSVYYQNRDSSDHDGTRIRHEDSCGLQFHIVHPGVENHELETSVLDPDPVGSAFNLGLDPGSGSVFGIRIQLSKKKVSKAKIYYE
jgi:hypothetical protein